MSVDIVLQHPFTGRVLVLLAAISVLALAQHSELLWLLTAIAIALSFVPEAATSRSVYGLYGMFLWALFAMELHLRYGVTGQLVGVFLLYATSTVIARWMTSVDPLRSWVLAQAVGIAVAETYLILLFWPVNFPSQALMITAVGFLSLEVIRLAHDRSLTIRTLALPLMVIALATTGTVLTASWIGY
ncbi:MAG: hypothetical protein AAB701_02480 [Patescibacteria group bacterium]